MKLGRAMKPRVAPAQVIREDDNDIGWPCHRRGDEANESDPKEEQAHVIHGNETSMAFSQSKGPHHTR
jgi:hypothetical protein